MKIQRRNFAFLLATVALLFAVTASLKHQAVNAYSLLDIITANDGTIPFRKTVPKIKSSSANNFLASCALILPTTTSFPSSGGSGTVTVANCQSWTVSTSASWIGLSVAVGTGTFSFTLSTNNNAAERTGTILVKNGKSIVGSVFIQQAAGCSADVLPPLQSFSAAGGYTTASVAAASSCHWSINKNVSWITLSYSGISGDGIVWLTIASNPNTTSRSGVVTIAGQSFPIFQAGTGCSYPVSSITPSFRTGQANFTATGGPGSFNVMTTSSCAWQAASNSSWITFTGPDTGSGNGTVNFAVAANTGSARTGTITLPGQTIIVTQPGPGCTYSLTPASINIGAPGGNGSSGISASLYCTWTVSSHDPSWIMVTGGASGISLDLDGNGIPDNGTFAYTIQANPGASRIGTISVSGSIFTVNQAGSAPSPEEEGLQFYPLTQPLRLLDTRPGQTGCFTPGAPLSGETPYTQTVHSACGDAIIPATARAITGTVTTAATSKGQLTLYSGNAEQSAVAQAMFTADEGVPRAFTVGLGKDGAFKLLADNPLDVVVEVTGYYAPPSEHGLYFHPLPQPVRLSDTRAGRSGCNVTQAAGDGTVEWTPTALQACGGAPIPSAARVLVGHVLHGSPAEAAAFSVESGNLTPANPLVGQQTGNHASLLVPLSPTGGFKIQAEKSPKLTVEVIGYYSSEAFDANGAGLLFYLLPQSLRLAETPTEPTCQALGWPTEACSGGTLPLVLAGQLTSVRNEAGQPSARRQQQHWLRQLLTDGMSLDVFGYFAP